MSTAQQLEDRLSRAVAAEEPRREAGSRTDPLVSALQMDVLEESIDSMRSDGIIDDSGESVIYHLQRPLGPVPSRANGTTPADKYEGVDRIVFVRNPTGKHLRHAMVPGDISRLSDEQVHAAGANEIGYSWIMAYSSAPMALVDRLDGDDFRGAAHVAQAVHQKNFRSSIVTGRQ